MYEDDDVISVKDLCDVLTADHLYSRGELVQEIITPEWSKLKHPRIVGFFRNDSPQIKMAILISKKHTLSIPLRYTPISWVSYDNPNDPRAIAEEEIWRWDAFATKEVRVMVVESFFKKNCLPYPASLFPSYVINSKKVYDVLFDDIHPKVKRRLSLVEIQEAITELQKNPLPVAGGEDVPGVAHKNKTKPAMSKKEQDKQDALAVAAEYWEANPELRPMQVAEAILGNHRVEWRCQAPKPKTLRNWLAPHAPEPAQKIGRPPCIPK